MTTLYNETVWNYDAPAEDIAHTAAVGSQLDSVYDSRGRTQDFYWEPAAPTPGGGLFTIRRVWTDRTALEEWLAEITNLRNSDPILAECFGVPIICEDDNYNPPTT
jgi:hypothetical protein